MTHAQWHAETLERFPFCIKCGTTKNLHVHHLIGKADKRYATHPLNGITLCCHCHEHAKDAPHQSPKQFEAWLQTTLPNHYAWMKESRWKR